MADLEKAKKAVEFFSKSNNAPYIVVDNNKEGSADKFVAISAEEAASKYKIGLDDKRIVYSVPPLSEIKKAQTEKSGKAPSAEVKDSAAKPTDSKPTELKAPAAKPPAVKAPAAKAPAAKAPVAKPAAEPAPLVKSDFTMVSVHNDMYNWLLEHGLNVPQALVITQKYHASVEKQAPGTADEKLQRLSAPKAA